MMLLVRLFVLIKKGKKLKAPYYASTTAIRDYIITRNIVPILTLRPLLKF